MSEVSNEIAYKFADWRDRAQLAEAEVARLKTELADCQEKLRKAQATILRHAIGMLDSQ